MADTLGEGTGAEFSDLPEGVEPIYIPMQLNRMTDTAWDALDDNKFLHIRWETNQPEEGQISDIRKFLKENDLPHSRDEAVAILKQYKNNQSR